MPLSLVTAPTSEPLTLEEAKYQLQLSEDAAPFPAEDLAITRLIRAARQRCESQTDRALETQTWDLVLNGWPAEPWIEVPKPPLISVTSVQYLDTGGVWRTWSPAPAIGGYLVDAPAGDRCRRGRVHLPFAGIWPIVLLQPACVRVRFVCGYADGAPALLKSAMLLDVGTLFGNRESILTGAREQAIELPSGTSDIYRHYKSHATQRLPL